MKTASPDLRSDESVSRPARRLSWGTKRLWIASLAIVIFILSAKYLLIPKPQNGAERVIPSAVPVTSQSTWLGDRQVDDVGDRYVITMPVPKVEEEQLQVSLSDRQLVVFGQRKSVLSDQEGANRFRRSEMQSSFRKTITLPNDAASEIDDVQVEDGVLKVTVPKA